MKNLKCAKFYLCLKTKINNKRGKDIFIAIFLRGKTIISNFFILSRIAWKKFIQ